MTIQKMTYAFLGVLGILVALLIGTFFAPQMFGAVTKADGIPVVGVIVKTGTHMDTFMPANFTVLSEQCNPEFIATSTPALMCTNVYYQGQRVQVVYALPSTVPIKQYSANVGSFPFSGGITFSNWADNEIETKLRAFINGNISLDILVVLTEQ